MFCVCIRLVDARAENCWFADHWMQITGKVVIVKKLIVQAIIIRWWVVLRLFQWVKRVVLDRLCDHEESFSRRSYLYSLSALSHLPAVTTAKVGQGMSLVSDGTMQTNESVTAQP